MSNYKKTVGIEVHCELKTKTKMFSNTLNNYGAKENSQVNTIDLAYPGSLPLVNKGAILLALKAALITSLGVYSSMFLEAK